MGCETPYPLKQVIPLHDKPAITIAAVLIEQPQPLALDLANPCREFLDLCPISQRLAQSTDIKNIDGTLPQTALSVYPNPAGNLINIPMNAEGTIHITARIYDMQGRLLIENIRVLEGGTPLSDLDISGLNTGPYFIRLEDDRSTVYPLLKFVKE